MGKMNKNMNLEVDLKSNFVRLKCLLNQKIYGNFKIFYNQILKLKSQLNIRLNSKFYYQNLEFIHGL